VEQFAWRECCGAKSDLQPATTLPKIAPMKLPLALCGTVLLTLATSCAEQDPSAPEKKPGLMHRLLHPFGGGKAGDGKKPKARGKLDVSLRLEPLPLKLSQTNRLKVTLMLANRTRKLASLEFPTSQRIEVLIRTSGGKLVEQWSQDQAFTHEATIVTVNPGERAEYRVEVATRDLNAGQSYVVQGFFPNYESLKAEATLVPEP
jgi:Intracellular proteinase inhibitor